MNLGNAVRFWATWQPDGESLVVGDQRIGWAEFHERTSRLANGLRAIGIGKGDRVGILSGNCLEYVELAVAGYKVGSILVPLNVRLAPPELRYIIDHAGCRAVVADAELAELGAAALDGGTNGGGASEEILRIGLGDGFGLAFDELRSGDDTDPNAVVEAGDVAYICYTSGTTGSPKGAMLSHGNLLAMAFNRILADDLVSASRVYLPYPLSFTGGLVSTYAPTYVGGATLVLDKEMEPTQCLEVIEREGITNFAAVPVIWEMIVNNPRFGEFDLSSLRVIGSGGASAPGALIQRLRDAGLPMSQGYGLTEGAGFNAWLRAEDAQRKIGSCGRPMMQTKMRFVDPDNEDALVDVAPGEVGELIIAGPEIMLGYWNNPEATAKTLIDGWLRTGDLARADDEGFVYIVDRSKDMLISGGLNVYPAEIEAVLAEVEGLAECAVIGVPDDRWGETPAALLVPRPGARVDAADVVARCRANLADYKRPRYIVIREEPLPRGMSGKVLKRELRDEYAEPATLGPAVH